jgi:SAM-dependent methyltransferase
VAIVLVLLAARVAGQSTQEKPYEPVVGQAGKDVVWVPTPAVLVERMLDFAGVTADDYVIDLGSGDGRNIIAAARRGARALGVEYNPDLVELSRRNAAAAGVSDKATFVEGDMFETDFSDANVLVLFLLPDNLRKLRQKFLELRPGTRIVVNTFSIEGWSPDQTDRVCMPQDDTQTWCTAMLWIVPAQVGGTWRLGDAQLTLEQTYQTLTGTLSSGGVDVPIGAGKLNGDQISFTAGIAEYAGRVNGDAMSGDVKSGGNTGTWSAIRIP